MTEAIRASLELPLRLSGGLAGIRWGIDGIPAEWLAGMRGRPIVEPLVDRLMATDGWRA